MVIHGAGRRGKVHYRVHGTLDLNIPRNILKGKLETSFALTGPDVLLPSSNQVVDATNPVS
jgi:hypothetical protein